MGPKGADIDTILFLILFLVDFLSNKRILALIKSIKNSRLFQCRTSTLLQDFGCIKWTTVERITFKTERKNVKSREKSCCNWLKKKTKQLFKSKL